MSEEKDKDNEGFLQEVEFVFVHNDDTFGFAFKSPQNTLLQENDAEKLEEAVQACIEAFFNDLPMKKEGDDMENNAETSTTQPIYIDSSGRIFTANDIVGGYKPKGKYKGYSISDRVKSWKPKVSKKKGKNK
jgi:hypothetical protein